MLAFYLLLLFCIHFGETARILVVFPLLSYSHNNVGYFLSTQLARRGHQVVFLGSHNRPEEENLRVLYVDTLKDSPMFEKFRNEIIESGEYSALGQLHWAGQMGLDTEEITLKHPKVQEMILKESFDLVIVDQYLTDALIVFGQIFECPVVLVAPGPPNMHTNYLVGNPSPSAYVPNMLSYYPATMSFFQRVHNCFLDLTQNLYREFIHLRRHQAVLDRSLKNAPKLQHSLYNTSLLLAMSHVSLFGANPQVPQIKEVGGFHIPPVKPLSQEFQYILNNSSEAGVVIFSMGSNIKSHLFKQEKIKAIIQALSRLKQTVVFKCDEPLKDVPKNFRVVKWLPQNDILASSKIKLFISHGGLFSTMEAVYHAVPILGIPVAWDHELNINTAVQWNYGLSVPLKTLTTANFEKALTEILSNKKFKRNVKKISQRFHDRPVDPLQETMFWIEYVIRHKGAYHLQASTLKLNFFQNYLLDILVFFIVVLLVLWWFLRKLFNKCFVKIKRTKIE